MLAARRVWTIQAAASAEQSDAQESYDYTLQHYSDQVSPIQAEADFGIEEIPQELAKIVKAMPTHTPSHAHLPKLLSVVTHDPTTPNTMGNTSLPAMTF